MKPAQTCRGRMGLAVLALGLGAGCAAPRAQFTDADWVSHSATGRGCYERGDFRRGADAYGRAEQRAQALDDADALAVAAVNRAVCLLAIGQAEPALQGANEALADARVAPGRQAELQVAAARAEVALGRFAPAQARLAAVLKSNPSPALRAQALLAQSAAELALGNPAGAGEILEKGLSAGAWAGLPPLLRAEHAVRLGEIAAVEKQPAEAAARQDEAAALWKQAGRLPEMARALAEGGRQAQAAGDWAGACDRFYRAARSLWTQGLQPDAVRVLEEGIECAEQLDDEDVGKKLAALFVTFKDEKRLTK